MRIIHRLMGSAVSLAILFGSVSLQAQIMVAVEDGSPAGTGAEIVSQLNDDTWGDFTATLVTADDIDTPAELAAYDVVILGGSGFNNADWTAAMSAAVHDFVQAGGGAILTGWGNHDINGAGLIHDPLDAIFPGQNIASSNQFTSSGEVMNFVTSHPVVNGVTGFSVVGCCTEINNFALELGDTQLATNAGGTAVAVKTFGTGRSVYLGTIFMARTSYTPVGNGSLRSGEPDRLLEQAVIWASGGSTAPPVTYSLAGMVSGLTGTGFVLQNNGIDTLAVAAAATSFTFLPPLADSAPYAVTVLTQPTDQTCTVTGGSNNDGTGTISAANVTDLAVACVDDAVAPPAPATPVPTLPQWTMLLLCLLMAGVGVTGYRKYYQA